MRKAISKGYKHFDVHVLPVLKDNYTYAIQCHASKEVALVDVSEVKPVVSYMTEKLGNPKFSILTTHKHWDHSGGNKDMAKQFPGLAIFGGAHDDIPAVTQPLNDGDVFGLGELKVAVLHTPCHTSGHVLYHVYHEDAKEDGALFTGDTLFVGGIGAFFEGDAAQMVKATTRIANLPPNTDIYAGHEYTVNFLKFSRDVEPDNAFVSEKLAYFEKLRGDGLPTMPSTVADEKRINLFMRHSDPVLQKATGISDAVQLMQHLYDRCP